MEALGKSKNCRYFPYFRRFWMVPEAVLRAHLELYRYTARKHFGAVAAPLGGVDSIVFTGGIGEHAAPIREKICSGLEYLGVELDRMRNAAHQTVISTTSSQAIVRVITTDEDLVIAKHVARLFARRRI